jgi:hypothetical protein
MVKYTCLAHAHKKDRTKKRAWQPVRPIIDATAATARRTWDMEKPCSSTRTSCTHTIKRSTDVASCSRMVTPLAWARTADTNLAGGHTHM